MVTVDDPPRPHDAPPGWDDDDPYEGEDLETYPDWWRANIAEFKSHRMRPYRPPRFSDGVLTPETIAELESALEIDILIRAFDPGVGDDWDVVVDGEPIGSIGRRRSGEGYTVYEIPSGTFESMIRTAVDG